MKINDVQTPDDIERYIYGCLNDFENCLSDKDETMVALAELVVHVYEKAQKQKCYKSCE